MVGRCPARFALGAAAVAAVVLVPAAAQAQFGALRRAVERKTEEKVAQRVDDKTNVGLLQEPTFDATTVELTDALLDRYLAAAEQLRGRRAERQAAAQLVFARYEAQRDSADRLDDPAGRQRHDRVRAAWDDCRGTVDGAMRREAERKQEATVARLQANPMSAMNDPQMKQMTALNERLAAAQARGDEAEARRILVQLQNMFGAVDSVSVERAAVAKCGARPEAPAWIARQAAVRLRADSSYAEFQRRSREGGRPGAVDLKLTPTQAAMVNERLASWLAGMRPDAPVTVRFTRGEYDRLVARRDALKRAVYGS